MSEKRRDNKGRLLRMGESQRKDGKYEFKYVDFDGERKTIYSWRLVKSDSSPANKRQDLSLREKEEQIQTKLISGIVSKPHKKTLNDEFRVHMSIKKYENSTRENYEYMWEKFIQNTIGRADITMIKKSDIKKFYAEKSNAGLADGTIQMLHKMIHPSLQIAVDDELIRKNPADGCCKEYTSTSKEKVALTYEEEQEFLEYLQTCRSRQQYNLLFRVMLGTSCRIGEIMGLTWADVDMKNRTVSIDHSVLYRKKDGKVQFYAKSTKSENGVRQIPMTEDVYECFKELSKNRFLHPSAVDIDGYQNFVFTSGKGKPLYPANINKALYRIVDRYNKETGKKLPRISNHIFRHTGCTRMAEAEIDPNTMMYVMGHGNLKLIMKTYDHVNLDRAKKQMKKLDSARHSAI